MTKQETDTTSGHEPDQTEKTNDGESSRDLLDELKQQEYRREYLKQQRQQNCPGCGDDGTIF